MSRECPSADSGADGQPPKSTYVPPPPPDGEEEIFRTVQMGINFSNYEKIPVECTGEGAPRQGMAR